MAPQGNLLARAEAVVERAFRMAAEHESTLARARHAVQPLRAAAERQDAGGPSAPNRPRDGRPA
jgi:hypothetical protein